MALDSVTAGIDSEMLVSFLFLLVGANVVFAHTGSFWIILHVDVILIMLTSCALGFCVFHSGNAPLGRFTVVMIKSITP